MTSDTFQLLLLNETEPSKMFVSDGMQYLHDKAENKEWWIMISYGAMDQITKIVETFYRGRPADFIPALAGSGVLFSIARKTRMNYKQLYAILNNQYLSPRTAKLYESLSEVDKKSKDILPMLGPNEEGNRLVLKFHMEFLVFSLRKSTEQHGLEKVIGKQCYWRFSLQAKYENRADEICHDKPVKANVGFQPDGKLCIMPLCQKHWDYILPFIEKQPDMF